MKWILVLVGLPFLLAAGALWLNRAPLLDTPGPLQRIKLYLSTHVAETRVDHERAELRPLLLDLPENKARDLVIQAMRRLCWQQIEARPEVLRAVVVTPLLRFRDDVEVRLIANSHGVLVHVRSGSRLGRGDFGANTRHILDLYRQLEMPSG